MSTTTLNTEDTPREPNVLNDLVSEVSVLEAALLRLRNGHAADHASLLEGCLRIVERLKPALVDVHNYIVDESVPATPDGYERLGVRISRDVVVPVSRGKRGGAR